LATYDLIVKGAKVLSLDETLAEFRICISDGKIVALDRDGSSPPSSSSSHVIDAHGKLVLPGLIDPHVHFRDPGLTYKEDFESGSRGAAAGGVTVVFDMPTTIPVVTSASILEEKREIVGKKSLIDYGLIAAASDHNLGQIGPLARAGAIAFKTFLVAPPKDRLAEQAGAFVRNEEELAKAMSAVAKTGLVHCVHAESDSQIASLVKKIREEGREAEPMSHFDSRPNSSEADAVFAALGAAKRSPGSRLHVLHVSAKESVGLIGDAKRQGVDVSAETCPQYLYFTKEFLKAKGPYAKHNPPARTEEDRAALMAGLSSGVIDMTATDHAPHSKEEKERGRDDIFRAPSGIPGVETRLPLLLTLVSKGALELRVIPKITSEAAARRFGLFPAKGCIEVGSDADLTFVDYDEEWTIDSSKLQTKARECDVYDGMQVKGRVTHTILRGQLVFEQQVGFGKPGMGRMLIPRTSPS
jgi:allantoinase